MGRYWFTKESTFVSNTPPRMSSSWSVMSRPSLLSLYVLLMTLAGDVSADVLTFHVPEQESSRTVVGNFVEAARLSEEYLPDALAELRFRFRDSSSLFEIVENTGVIRTSRTIDRELLPECMFSETCVFELDVTITPYRYFQVVPIAIHVDDINDHAPEFPESRVPLSIPENVAVNSTYDVASAEDPDSAQFGISYYELVRPSDVFAIDVTTLPDGTQDLSVRVLRALDRETENFYSLEVRAVDGGDPARSGTMTIDISVSDHNDNNPVFESHHYEATIYENLDTNTPVVQVSATDKDEGDNGRVVYEFEHNTEAEFGSWFGIESGSGLIFVKGDIDYENHKSFNLRVVARDGGDSAVPDYTTVEIQVKDVNDNPPVISVDTFTDSSYARVPENAEAGHTVAYVGVSDPDTGAGGNVTCGLDNGHFQMQGRPNSDMRGFEIVSSHPFDREEQDHYTILVHCEDQGSPQLSSSVRITIHVTDENDNDPVFVPNTPNYALTVPENNNVGDVLIKVNATDRDSMENAAIRYSLEPVEDTPKDAIQIDLITGVIRANVQFDYEKQVTYQYRIRASDQGVPPRVVETSLTVHVLDTNDGFPHFLKATYSFSVRENLKANTWVGDISAVDNDAAPHNHIVYSLEPGRDSYKFDINADTGDIMTATILDREEAAVYRLVGVASNRGASHIKTTVNITVTIDDDNDNSPVILFPNEANNTVQVPTRMDVGYHVTQIEAYDPDASQNAQLEYAIISGNEGSVFVIDPDTGAISTAVATHMANLRTQKLVIKVKDGGQPERKTPAYLNVVFNDSVAVSKGAASLLEQDTITILIVAAIAGCVFIVIIITVAICCLRRSRNKHEEKENVYNCRAEEAKKALSMGERTDCSSSPDSGLEKSIDTGINKAKEKSKKEVTFSVDMDNGWPMQSEKAVIENPHAQHIDPSDCRPPPPHHPDRAMSPALSAGSPGDDTDRPASRQNSTCCACHKHGHNEPICRAPPLTQQNLDMLEYNLLWHNSVDRDSESGCSGTDSGRGPSEEGECGHHAPGEHGGPGHEQCGHGTCCCSSGIYAKKYHLHPGLYPRAPCHCYGPVQAPPYNTCSHGHGCGSSCSQTGVKRNPSHCSVDECTPLESLPQFSRPFTSRMYPKPVRCNSDCHGPRAARHRLALDPEEMAKHRHYGGYAPSLPSLTDRHIPSPTFTSASDSQFYPYTGAHPQHGTAPGYGAGSKAAPCNPVPFAPIKRSPSRDDDRSMTLSDDDGTTMSGSYSLENMRDPSTDPARTTVKLGEAAQDCYV